MTGGLLRIGSRNQCESIAPDPVDMETLKPLEGVGVSSQLSPRFCLESGYAASETTVTWFRPSDFAR